MNRAYIIRHWVLTLLLAPLISQAIQSIWGIKPQVSVLLELYPITLLFSVACSLPTFLVYLTGFYFLSKQHMNFALAKAILIAVTVSGIYITQTIIKGTMSHDIIIAYSVTSIIVGLILKLRKSEIKTQDNFVAA